MGGLLNYDNPVLQFINKVVDIIILSTIWTVMCSPAAFCAYVILSEEFAILFWLIFIVALIPVGPATTAMYYSTVKVIRKERGYVLREFFRSLKRDFKQGAALSILIGFIAGIVYFDYTVVTATAAGEGSKMNEIVFIALNVVTLICIFCTLYVFPVLSRWTLTLKQLLKNSLVLSLRHLPTTLLLVIFVAAFALATWILWGLPTFLILPGLTCLLCSFPMERVFKKYMTQAEEQSVPAAGDGEIIEGSMEEISSEVAETTTSEEKKPDDEYHDRWYLE